MDKQFYREFEDKYRGSRELIKSRLLAYKPFIEPFFSLMKTPTVLDLGCGRGEWLEIASSWGCKVTGVDLDDGMLAACASLDAETKKSDALEFARKVGDDTFSVVSSFHMVEHLQFEYLYDLIQECRRILIPGGILILETPNPENILVGTKNFYTDPTHKNPIPPELLSFVPEQLAFSRVKVLRLQEDKGILEKQAITVSDIVTGVSPDYAVVAQKFAKKSITDRWENPFGREYGVSLNMLLDKFERSRIEKEAEIESSHAKIAAVSDQLSLVQQNLGAMAQQMTGVLERQQTLLAEVSVTSQSIESLASDLVIIKPDVIDLKQSLNEARSEMAIAHDEISQIHEKNAGLEQYRDVFENTTTELKHRIEQSETAHSTLLVEITQAQKRIVDLNQSLETIEPKIADLRQRFESNELSLGAMQEQRVSDERKIAELDANQVSISHQCEDLISKLRQNAQHTEELEKELAYIKSETRDFRSRIKKCNAFLREHANQVSTDLRSFNDRVVQSEVRVAGTEERLGRLIDVFLETKKTIDGTLAVVGTISSTQNGLSQQHDAIRGVLDGLKDQFHGLLTRFTDESNKLGTMNDLFMEQRHELARLAADIQNTRQSVTEIIDHKNDSMRQRDNLIKSTDQLLQTLNDRLQEMS